MTLRKVIKTQEESLKRDGTKTLRQYLQIFNTQCIINIGDKTAALQVTSFIPDLIDDLLVLIGDYHDSVREEACKTLLFIGDNFINFSPNFEKE